MFKLLRFIAYSLVALLVGVTLLESLLITTDPLGVMQYGRSLQWIRNHSEAHETGYRHPAGVHDTPFGRVTILADGTRWTGGTLGGCKLVVVGDSVSFGLGVTDDDTFAAHLARLRPGWHIINAARVGYDSTNLSRLLEHYEADAYVYLVTGNDASQPIGVWPPLQLPSAIRLHASFIQSRTVPPRTSEAFDQALRVIKREGVQVVAFEDSVLLPTIRRVTPVVTIPPHNAPISVADSHPNAAGHRHIANALYSTVYCKEPS